VDNLDSQELDFNDKLLFEESLTDTPKVRYGYVINQFNFLVPEKMTSEVLQSINIFNLPKAPYWIKGLINIRGNIVPVMNLHAVLTDEFNNINSKHVLIIGKGLNTLGILIDELPQSITVTKNVAESYNMPEVINAYLEPGLKYNGKDWIEFNLQEFFLKLKDTSH